MYTLQKATHLTMSAKQCCIKWKITNFSSFTLVCNLLCSQPPQKFAETSFAQKLQFIGHISVRDS